MRELQKHIGNESSESDIAGSKRQVFLLTRHYIGRLGSHVRAAKTLTIAGQRLPHLFDNFAIKPRPSPKPPILPPLLDNLTTLDGIIKRMLPKDSEDTPRYQNVLNTMDAKFHIQSRLQAQYQDKEFRPRVHAELHLLEYFYHQKLSFVDDDRFIGCSKPACYSCYLYISNHPGGFIRPASHTIRYINWRAPDIIDVANQNQKNHQRDVLNKMIVQIRLDTLRQIDRRTGPSPWRPDSTTGITDSQRHHDDYRVLEQTMNSCM